MEYNDLKVNNIDDFEEPHRDYSSPIQESPSNLEEKYYPSNNYSKSWGTENPYSAIVLADAIESYLLEHSTDSIIVEKKVVSEFKYEFDKSCDVLLEGVKVFVIDSILVQYRAIWQNFFITSNKPIDKLVEEIDKYIRTKNKLIGRNYSYTPTPNKGVILVPARPNTMSFDDIVVGEKIKELIVDNTVFHLQHMDVNNGIIITGPPGCGKSMLCGAVITEACKEGTTAITCSTFPFFPVLEEIANLFLPKALIILEDIDTYAESRHNVPNQNLGALLQYLNGVNGRNGKTVYIATTNYPELLDEAIKNRPVRFNVKVNLTFLTNDEIVILLQKLYKSQELNNIDRCFNKNLTGSHLEEIYRRSVLQHKKTGISICKAFDVSVSEVLETFFTSRSQAGFTL